MCIQPLGQPKTLKEYVLELLKYHGKWDLHDELKNWQIPRFPLSGTMLKQHNCPGGQKMGVVMSKLKEEWVKSHFESGADELLAHLPRILDEMQKSDEMHIKRQRVE